LLVKAVNAVKRVVPPNWKLIGPILCPRLLMVDPTQGWSRVIENVYVVTAVVT